ncbi:MAG TPA: IS481 family transposase [Bryobacteraceae bacterium]
MGWKESNVLEERFRFVEAQRRGEQSIAELCREYGITRPTAYKWLARYGEEGIEGLRDRSRAPHHPAHGLEEAVKTWILAVKAKHPFWGARKIVAYLEAQSPGQQWPAVSSVGELLKQQGLTVPRKRQRRREAASAPLAHADSANRVWSVDFKGWFHTTDGRRCEPFTLTDNYSRYLLRCQALPAPTTVQIQPVMVAAFREYGLPERIRSDNGAPFGSNGESGLTTLSVWWIRLGIFPERIRPGHPQQNGRHERMHLTLKQQTATPPAATLRQQQKRFDAFRQEYNSERPHEALGQKPPAQFFEASPRPYPARLPELEYPADWQIRRVCAGGKFRCGGRALVFLSHALVGECIGLQPIDDRYGRLWFGAYELGVLDKAQASIYSPSQWQRWLARQAQRGLPTPEGPR